uniref:CSON003427 protein n=1 Tax=Culicoides sonorensis TaxID=179676 RepID=A0A336MLD2_CULSO
MESKVKLLDNSTCEELTDCILSISWNSGVLGAVCYDMSTMEITIVQEIIDTRPDFMYLNNLLRQVCPSYLLINGTTTFTSEVLKFLDLPENFNYNTMRKQKNKPTRSNIQISPIDSRKSVIAKTRLSQLKLPGMPSDTSESSRLLYLSSIIPLNQSLVVYSFYTLLEYLEANFKKTFCEDSLIITNINTCQLKNQLMIDLSSLYGLQIFSSNPNQNLNEHKNKCNLFNVLNQCISSIGSNALKELVMSPTRDLKEIRVRQNTVEWCMMTKNFETVKKIRHHLRKIKNTSLLCKRIIYNMGKAHDIQLLKMSILNAYLICEECAKCCAADPEIENTIIKCLAEFTTESRTIKGVLFSLDKIVDLIVSKKENRFVVKTGLDLDLDRKKELLNSVKSSIYEPEQIKKLNLPNFVTDFYLVYMEGVGFVILVETEHANSDMFSNSSTNEPLDIIFRKDHRIYFKTSYCKELTSKYGNLYGEICCHEKRIFDRMVKYLIHTLPELIAVNKMCAKLDCLIGFASVAIQRQYVKPVMVNHKCLFIEQGRHPLIEIINNFKANDTNMNDTFPITILSASNASGKSVYMKQVALIAFMAHIGSFVPANNAKIGILDTIFTRIHCPESIHLDESSYFSDLKQMSFILMSATCNSLVLIDEFGKGTNVKEGQALLAACIENIANRKKGSSLAIISTHFHEIFKLINNSEKIILKTFKSITDEFGYRSLYELIEGYSSPKFSVYNETYNLFGKLLASSQTLRILDLDITYDMILATRLGFVLSLLYKFKQTKQLEINEIFNLFQEAKLARYNQSINF